MSSILRYLGLTVFVMVIFICFTNCKAVKGKSPRNESEDFVSFYNRFHQDSLFQVSRYKYPMGGKLLKGSVETAWTKQNMPLMLTKIYDVDTSEYQVVFKKTKKVFTQKVWIENSDFSSEYRFELIKSKWYLVYILDQNF